MQRDIRTALDRWLSTPGRRPLILRGARQVGKTWLARDLAARVGRPLVEVNLEREPGLAELLRTPEPQDATELLALRRGAPIDITKAILFIDEIQVHGDLLKQLRWFHERLPELAVIAAGSLLEFTLAEHDFSMPVGRVSFLNVEPMTFREVLHAHGESVLLDAIDTMSMHAEPGLRAETIHERAMIWWRRHAMVGGMPAVVQADVAGHHPTEIRALQLDLAAAYRADFAAYRRHIDPTVLNRALGHAAATVGQKFVYSHLGEGIKRQHARLALEMLENARVCRIVRHSNGTGVPLAAEVNERHRKAMMLDVGLFHALLRTPAGDVWPPPANLPPSLRGSIAEQLLAQELAALQPWSGDGARLYYWQRSGGRAAELDFLANIDAYVVPVEVKSGAAGSMKSLHQFMHSRQLDIAVRVDSNPPSRQRVDVKTTTGQPVSYQLLSVPPYLLYRLPEFLRAARSSS